MVEKYMKRNKKISISQVDILEFFNFYKEIAKYQYLYTLENNLKIKLAFNESNFPYLLGLHKFKIVSKYRKQSDIIEAIKFLKISLWKMEFIHSIFYFLTNFYLSSQLITYKLLKVILRKVLKIKEIYF